MTKRRRSPQEKKALSYTRDRRNRYGENAKSSRKNIPRRKRLIARAERHAQHAALGRDARLTDAETMVGTPARALGGKHRNWRKQPDRSLGRVIKAKLEHRKPR
jgi:hypothetical protein